MSFKTFEEIEAWQEARALMKKIRTICKARAKNDWTWVDQATRATLSIMANIAEGNDTNTNAEFIQFLSYAKRSSTEVRSHLYYALDEGYVSQDEFADLSQQSLKITKQLFHLIQYLRTHSQRTRQNLKPATLKPAT